MKFKLQSRFSPTGDQPEVIEGLVKSVKAGSKHQTLAGVTGSGKTFTLANVINKTNLPTLVISHNKTLAAQLYQEFRDFFPGNAVSYFVSYYDYYQPEAYVPSTDTYIEKETDINDEIDKLRLSATANLLSRPDVIVVASVSCIYNLGSPENYDKNFIELKQGQVISRTKLTEKLLGIQYLNSDYDLTRGSFRLKGDTLSIWPANLDYALKISFLESHLEAIHPINPVSGVIMAPKSLSSPLENRYIIYPAKHYQSDLAGRDVIFAQIKRDLGLRLQEFKRQGKLVEAYRLGQRVKHDLEMIGELGYVNGIENYSRYFDHRSPGEPPFSLLDYFKFNASKFKAPGFLTIIDESHITLPQLKGMFRGDQSRKQTLIDFGFRLPSALDNRPLKFSEIIPRLPQVIYSSATPSQWELDQSSSRVFEQLIRPTGLTDPEIEIRPVTNQIPDLVTQIIKRKSVHERVLVTTLTKRTAEALTDYLNDPAKITPFMREFPKLTRPKVQYLHADVETLDRQDILDSLRLGEFDVVVGINLLREGLDLPEVSLVAILEADKEGFLRSKTSLIQTMGRAARHLHGHVIMYANVITQSMAEAIKEVSRRRAIQITYNQKHQITPTSISKPIRDKLLVRPTETAKLAPNPLLKPDLLSLTPEDTARSLKKYRKLMREAAKNWDFEQAARYRDLIKTMERV